MKLQFSNVPPLIKGIFGYDSLNIMFFNIALLFVIVNSVSIVFPEMTWFFPSMVMAFETVNLLSRSSS